jgi:hypothetical protein
LKTQENPGKTGGDRGLKQRKTQRFRDVRLDANTQKPNDFEGQATRKTPKNIGKTA